MKSLLPLLVIFLSFQIVAQKAPLKFGDVSLDELKMEVYDRDPAASAVVLADFGESAISFSQSNGFELRFKRICRIKILKKDGYDWATQLIPVYKQDNVDEKVSGLKGVTFNLENGKVVESKLEKSAIFTENVNENWDNVKFTMPNVREGSVIDFTYQVTSPYVFNFQDWSFQTTIPTIVSEYNAYIPEYFEYQKYAQGYVGLKVSDVKSGRKTITFNSKERGSGFSSAPTSFSSHQIEYDEMAYKWVATDVPAFKEEPHMTTYKDYISKLNFELAAIKMPNKPVQTVMGTWENISKELMDSPRFGDVINKPNYLNKMIEGMKLDKSDPNKTIASIYSLVRNTIEWNGYYRFLADDNLKKMLEEKRGSSADINLTLVALLRKAGLTSYPIVISTRDHGVIRKQFPLSSQFNYVLASVEHEGRLVLLDATDRSLPIELIPKRCLNGTGLLIDGSSPRWVDLSANIKTRSITESNLEFDQNGSLKGKVVFTKEGYEGHEMRASIFQQGEEKFNGKISDLNNWTIHSSSFENKESSSLPLKATYEVSFNEHSSADSQVIYLDLLSGSRITDNPFKMEKREYPVDFGNAFESITVAKLKLPEGYIVDEMPQPAAVALPGNAGKYIHSISNSAGVLSLTSQFVINKPLFTQLEYPYLREFYSKVIAKQQEQIVLKKVE